MTKKYKEENMDIKHQSIILDVNKANILPNIIAHQGDQKTRFIDVTLTMSGEELILNDSYRAILKQVQCLILPVS